MISFFGPNFPTPQLVTNPLSPTLSSKHSIMASSSSSSKECSLTHTQNPNPNNFISNCLLLSSAFLPTPSLSPPFTLHSKPNPIHELHTTLVSAADGCFRTFNSFISSNPLLQNLSSFSNSFQIHCRNQSISKNSLSVHNFAAILPGDSVAGLVLANGISNFLNLYNTLLVCRLVLTWFPNSPPAIVGPLSTICDPYLNIFRGLIPPLGGTLDLSPILAFLVLNAFTSTAAALPAELPPAGASQNLSSSQSVFSNITSAQRKWMKRIYSSRSKNSTGQSDKKSLKI